ncbi:MAG TPA: glycosyltransferase family 2 protein [Chitinophagaceae bacterium]|nr:glycosyltransferase family 2 protein [Chitinophagaceae bacterium]
MLNAKKIVIVLPAYNASRTLEKTIRAIPEMADAIVVVDDCSADNTFQVALALGVDKLVKHPDNLGYGANQKTCYQEALTLGADIVLMIHPDYQYSPRMIPAMCAAIAFGEYDVAIGSRILGKGALTGGMPLYKYFFNRVLTFVQNILINQKMSEYHSGFRAYSADVLKAIPFESNSDDFIFDNELLCQVLKRGYRVCELSCPTRYDEVSSSISFGRSVVYGLGVLRVSFLYFFDAIGIFRSSLFRKS